ncbi:hypothetical protein CEXT_658221 [Caerostris extrusa]|uniref:Uncharacterized protein n=1 Tax=Caerostris extrusa TaxID=172846 RepID=A0AAV4S567_CAEEX|nr:hypothetical protein CEXT_658221 [Caerostris extrusa]
MFENLCCTSYSKAQARTCCTKATVCIHPHVPVRPSIGRHRRHPGAPGNALSRALALARFTDNSSAPCLQTVQHTYYRVGSPTFPTSESRASVV